MVHVRGQQSSPRDECFGAIQKKEKDISSIYFTHITKAWTDKDKSHKGRGGLPIIWLCFILLNKYLLWGKLYVTWILVLVQSQLSHTCCKVVFSSSKNKSVCVEIWKKLFYLFVSVFIAQYTAYGIQHTVKNKKMF